MKFYLKQHRSRFFGFLLILAFLLWVLGVAEAASWTLLLYLFLVGAFLLIAGLLFAYSRQRRLYAFLSDQTKRIMPGDQDHLSQAISHKVNQLLQEQENQLTKESREKEQQVTFINLWVHQMKTPIAVLEMMAQENQLDSVEVLKETQRLKSGLNLVMNEARLLGGIGGDFVLKRVFLSKLVNQAVTEQKNFFIQHQVYPQVMISEELTLITDAKWLSFVVEQLVVNSIKYTKPGGKVKISATKLPEATELIIEDEGVGIPVGDLPRIKQAFFTGENGRKFGEATGMGLYLVDQVTGELGIKFDLQSQVGKGTKAILTIPDGQ
ncbi:sensor histidine kinase [Enterococcus sp. 2201sp1_2201st1_B8_2201SCRN_220225]|uniref:sensor histidine kinase n=1 Tax=unclassified Enterococcus TaxID=2608891 RepID=UPI0034A119A7